MLGSSLSVNLLRRHGLLFTICCMIGVLIYLMGWSAYLSISLFVSVGIGFTIRLTRYWLSKNYTNMPLSVQFVSAIFIALALWGSAPLLMGWAQTVYQHNLRQYIGIVAMGGFFTVVISFVYYRTEQTMALKKALLQAELDQAKHEKVLAETELKLLQSQMEPHFLFNTLATIQALIDIDPKQANDMLNALTALLRQSLTHARRAWVSLEDELAFIRAYLAIQAVRLGERLDTEITVADSVSLATQFPPMLLQPLIENAVIHGIEQLPYGGKITIRLLSQNSTRLLIVIENSMLAEGSQKSGNGVALDNIKSRLQQIYQGSGHIDISQQQETFLVKLEVPFNGSAV